MEVELSPRRKELVWARVLLAWVRPFYLREELGENVVGSDVSLFLNDDSMLILILLLRHELSDFAWIRWIMICDSWLLTWCKHDVRIGWFMELKWWVWYGFYMRHEWKLVNEYGMVSVWDTLLHLWFGKGWMEWNSTWNVNEELVIKVGMRVLCMINITLLIEYVWSVLVRNSLKSLGEISG